MAMRRYKNLSGDSGVVAFELHAGAITVQFEDGWKYCYTADSAGAENVAHMQQLAQAGRGLSGFIVRQVRKGYARKFR